MRTPDPNPDRAAPSLRLVLCCPQPPRRRQIRTSLEQQGHDLVAQLESTQSLVMQTEILRPDAVIVAVERLAAADLQYTCLVCQTLRTPVVVLTDDGDVRTMHQASRAGVAAYVVRNAEPARLTAIVLAALMRFRARAVMQTSLGALRDQMPEPDLIAAAQHRIMRELRVSETQARQRLSRFATVRRLKPPHAARQLLDAACLEFLLAP